MGLGFAKLIRRKNVKSLVDYRDLMKSAYTNVGFMSSTGKHVNSDISVPMVAYFNEFGIGIPERPFFRSAWQAFLPKIKVSIQKGAVFMSSSVRPKIDSKNILCGIAMAFVSVIRRTIDDWTIPPNSLQTQKRKGAKVGKGVLIDNPLVDTGQMKQSVNYEYVEQ